MKRARSRLIRGCSEVLRNGGQVVFVVLGVSFSD
jgi:hypothetical protein